MASRPCVNDGGGGSGGGGMSNGSAHANGPQAGDAAASNGHHSHFSSPAPKDLVHVVTSANGGASYVVLDYKDVCSLRAEERSSVVDEFFREGFSLVDGSENEPRHVMAIVRGAASDCPDPLLHLAEHHPQTRCQVHGMFSKGLETTNIADYYKSVQSSYFGNCFCFGALEQISLVGTASEEKGGFFRELLKAYERVPFLERTMPWGPMSALDLPSPTLSDDGPIMWVRPGEQMVAAEAANRVPAGKRGRKDADRDRLGSMYSCRSKGPRETLFKDRTFAHADHIEANDGRFTTSAVGVLKAVRHKKQNTPEGLIVKDVIAFSAKSFNSVVPQLQIDLFEPPASQCLEWVEHAKLNALRMQGIEYAHIELQDGDVYYIPSNVVHQFRTVSACSSIAWHLRHVDYVGMPPIHKLPMRLLQEEAAAVSPRKQAAAGRSPAKKRRKPGQTAQQAAASGKLAVAVEEAQPSPSDSTSGSSTADMQCQNGDVKVEASAEPAAPEQVRTAEAEHPGPASHSGGNGRSQPETSGHQSAEKAENGYVSPSAFVDTALSGTSSGHAAGRSGAGKKSVISKSSGRSSLVAINLALLHNGLFSTDGDDSD